MKRPDRSLLGQRLVEFGRSFGGVFVDRYDAVYLRTVPIVRVYSVEIRLDEFLARKLAGFHRVVYLVDRRFNDFEGFSHRIR